MSHLAQRDTLTDLPDRILLQDRLHQAIALASRNNTLVGVLFWIWINSRRLIIPLDMHSGTRFFSRW
jgi:GGDEF domain-containing protein